MSPMASAEDGSAIDGLLFQNETFRDIPFSVVWIDLDENKLELFWKRPESIRPVLY